jgi:hypothetical protein
LQKAMSHLFSQGSFSEICVLRDPQYKYELCEVEKTCRVGTYMTVGNQLITNQQNKKSPSHKGHWNANSIKMQRARVQEVRAVHRAI